ncbi:MAG: hypothetical protein IT435_10605 [Phycisphaerales bacterium]|nr:hypothetical protein [Phycisphaerales bacterium]
MPNSPTFIPSTYPEYFADHGEPAPYIAETDLDLPSALTEIPTDTKPFNPTPEVENQVLTQLADPTHSLLSIAHANNTTLKALTLWLAKPQIAALANQIHTAAAHKAQLSAAIQLPRAIPSILITISAYQSEEMNVPLDHSRTGLNARARQRYASLRAIHYLLRIANYKPPHMRPTRSHSEHVTSLGAPGFSRGSQDHHPSHIPLSQSTLEPTSSAPPPPSTSSPCPSTPSVFSSPLPPIEEQILDNPDLLQDLINTATASLSASQPPPDHRIPLPVLNNNPSARLNATPTTSLPRARKSPARASTSTPSLHDP